MAFRMAIVALLIAFAGGCSRYAGVPPEGGYDLAPVDYTPRQNPDAVVFEIPFIDPNDEPESRLPLPEPLIWKTSMPLAFVGEIQKLGEPQGGTFLRIEMRPRLADGSLGKPLANQIMAMRKPGTDVMGYRVEWRAPEKPGKYRVAVLTIGPSKDPEAELVSFVEGDVEVQ